MTISSEVLNRWADDHGYEIVWDNQSVDCICPEWEICNRATMFVPESDAPVAVMTCEEIEELGSEKAVVYKLFSDYVQGLKTNFMASLLAISAYEEPAWR